MRGEIISKEYQSMVFLHEQRVKYMPVMLWISRTSNQVKT